MSDKHWIEAALQIANEEYFRQHLAQVSANKAVPDEGSIEAPINITPKPVSVGDYAVCDNCKTEGFVHYVYGRKYPLCKTCAEEILN